MFKLGGGGAGRSEVNSISEQISTLASNTGLWFHLMFFYFNYNCFFELILNQCLLFFFFLMGKADDRNPLFSKTFPYKETDFEVSVKAGLCPSRAPPLWV